MLDMDGEKPEEGSKEPQCTCRLVNGEELRCTCNLIEETTEDDGDCSEEEEEETKVDVCNGHKLQRGMQVDSLENIATENVVEKVSQDGSMATGSHSDIEAGESTCSVTDSIDSQNMPTSPASSDRSSIRKSKLPVVSKSPTENLMEPFETAANSSKLDTKQPLKTIVKFKSMDLSQVKSKIQSLPGSERQSKLKDKQSNYHKLKTCNTIDNLVQTPVPITANESHGIRETLTSRMRFEKKHGSHEIPDCEGESYLTPTQRNEQQVKYMRKEIKDLRIAIEGKEKEIEELKHKNSCDELKIFENKEKEVLEILLELDALKMENDKIRKSYEESVKSINALENTIRDLKETMAEKEKKSEALFLEMYRKGQETAKFEREEELERMAATNTKKSNKTGITINELMQKLNSTESELAKWQAYRRQESYESAEKPETQSDAILKFLKDSFFHYLHGYKRFRKPSESNDSNI
ncbi:hypothetical protein KUTeg_000816 [Tegillarca granosa]|uniref:Uncharacterized protein n=1 Tax=Tegillarca granosa TaxID=220873 RepID=A0ABQ9G1H0_TEGGR|nr:hypothetical protein KUTeg_000816 [Tegillarca granosa]